MTITDFLIRALLEENSVAITGLGVFSVKKRSACIKDEVIYPPQNMITFECSKEVEGFDFVSKLSQWEQIRIDEAQTKISEWITLLENGLEHNKSVFLDDFGTFSKDNSEQIVFQGAINSRLNVENEGFEPVVLAPLRTKKNRNIDEPIKDKRIVLVKKSRKRDKFWFALTILITIVALCFLFFKNSFPDFYQTVFTKKVDNTAVKNTENEDVAYINKMAKSEIDEDDIETPDNLSADELSNDFTTDHQKITQPESNDIYLSYQEGKYYVIAGSFVKKEDALRHIKDKKLEKYNAKLIVQPQNNRHRVCIGVFDNEKDAEQFAAKIDKNYWVLK